MSKRKLFSGKKKGFSLIEVMVTSFILGIFVFSLQKTIANIVTLKTLAEQDSILYEKAMNIMEYIQSGRGLSRYLLTKSELRRLELKGATFDTIENYIEILGKEKFIRNANNTIMNRTIKIDDKNYRVRINRKVLEPSPFMFGIEVKVFRGGKKASIEGIVSFYDLTE